MGSWEGSTAQVGKLPPSGGATREVDPVSPSTLVSVLVSCVLHGRSVFMRCISSSLIVMRLGVVPACREV